MDVVGFLLAGLGALLILASVAFTGVVKNGDAYENDDEVDQYVFEMKAKKIWLREVVWWLIKKGNTWFLFISSVGFLLQIPEKIWK